MLGVPLGGGGDLARHKDFPVDFVQNAMNSITSSFSIWILGDNDSISGDEVDCAGVNDAFDSTEYKEFHVSHVIS